jgi:hypothetical protein
MTLMRREHGGLKLLAGLLPGGKAVCDSEHADVEQAQAVLLALSAALSADAMCKEDACSKAVLRSIIGCMQDHEVGKASQACAVYFGECEISISPLHAIAAGSILLGRYRCPGGGEAWRQVHHAQLRRGAVRLWRGRVAFENGDGSPGAAH